MSKTKFFHSTYREIEIYAPTKLIIKKINRSLELISQTDKKLLRYVRERIRIVFVTNRRSYANSMETKRRIWFTNRTMIDHTAEAWIASLLLHEAVHVDQKKYSPQKSEREAIDFQKKFLYRIKEGWLAEEAEKAYSHKYWKEMAADKRSSQHFKNLIKQFSL
jgi:hypothetical protein